MRAQALRQFGSVADYLAWEEQQELRHELIGGEARLMAGGTAVHDLIAQRLSARLTLALAGRPCFVHGSNLKLKTIDDLVAYPDLMVRCGVFDPGAVMVDDPILVVEVLSASTSSKDLVHKRQAYQTIPTLQHLAYVDPSRVHVELTSREPDGSWRSIFLRDADDLLRLPALALELRIGDLYEGLALPGSPLG